MSDYDHTHDGPSGRWRRSGVIKISKEDTCYGPECPHPRRRAIQGGRIMTITALTPITATIGSYSSIITTVRGGTGPYSYYINTGSLPIGLNINLSTANISGTLTVASVTGSPYTFTILVVDSTGRRAVSNSVLFTVTATLWDLATWNVSNWS